MKNPGSSHGVHSLCFLYSLYIHHHHPKYPSWSSNQRLWNQSKWQVSLHNQYWNEQRSYLHYGLRRTHPSTQTKRENEIIFKLQRKNTNWFWLQLNAYNILNHNPDIRGSTKKKKLKHMKWITCTQFQINIITYWALKCNRINVANQYNLIAGDYNTTDKI